MQRNLWLALAVAGLAGAAFVALGRGPAERPFDEPTVESTDGELGDTPAEPRVADQIPGRSEVERRELELAKDLGLVNSIEDLDARAVLALRGRVVDTGGRPVGGADVEARVRRSPRAIFEGGGPPMDLGTDFQELFRERPLAKAAVTDADGTFAIDGNAFARGTSVELAIDHAEFAPALVTREWSATDGELVLPDVVIGAGALVTGVVVGPNGGPVPGATVQYADAGGGRGGVRGGGRGGRGAGRFAAFSGDRLAELVGATETDATGHFEIRHAPAGSFRLSASAPRHVDGSTDRVSAENGADVDVGEIQLGPGAVLTGIVVDLTGAPVADAEVSAAVSRDAMRERAQNQQGADNRGGGRGGLADLAAFGFGAPRTSTRTAADGRFALDRVPQLPLRVEVRHPNYTDADVEPVDPIAQPQIQVQVRDRPWISGVVVDASTGQPVETFGIRARMTRGFEFGFGGGGRGGRGMADMLQQFGNANPEVAAQVAEMQARAQREQDWRKRYVGDSGVVPQRTRESTKHAEGQFRLDDLQPGDYVLDVDAPGFIPVAAGPYAVTAAEPTQGLTIRVERGVILEGRVVDGRTGAPVPGARVALAIPPLEEQGANTDPFAMFGRMGGRRGGGRRDVLDDARTDTAGRFALRPLRAGTYALSVEAQDYPGLDDPAFTLTASSTGVDLRLDPGARVHGLVAGLDKEKPARLEFTHADTNARRVIDVVVADGSYQISGLLAGGYFVRVLQDENAQGGRGGRGGMREMVGNALAARSGATPDLVVPPGADLRFDVGADALEFAIVRGRVFRNGDPGGGLEVRLVAQVSQTGLDPQIERFAAGRLGGLWSGAVSADDGTFTVESVPPGDYVLEVRRRGGGGGGRGRGPQLNLIGGGGDALHSEPLTVRKGQTVERTIEVSAGAIELIVTGADGQPVVRAAVSFALAAEAGETPPQQWNGLPSFVRTGLRNGSIQSDSVAPGVYRYAIQAPGFKPVVGTINVLASSEPVRAEIRLEVDPGAPAAPQNGPPGGQGRGGR